MTDVVTHPTPHDRNAVLFDYGQALVALAPLILVYWSIPYDQVAGGFLRVSNAVLPFYFIAVTAYLGFRIARRVKGGIWTPLVWFPVQSAVFYGLGPLVEVYGNEITRLRLADHYLSITPQELFRANQLSFTGIFAVLSGIFLHAVLRGPIWSRNSAVVSRAPLINPYKLALLFVIAGGLFKYLVLNLVQWDIINLLVPGVLSNLGETVHLGFAIMAYCATSGNSRARFWMMSVFPVHVLLSLLSFSKLEVVITLLLPVLAAFTVHRNIRRFLINLGVIGSVFIFLQDYVHYGRAQVYQNTGTIWQAGYPERVSHLFEYLVTIGDDRTDFAAGSGPDAAQGWWTRLNFSGVQVRAMELYDSGRANPQLQDAWVRFVPRAIWPDKPILHGPGLSLYRELSANAAAVSFLGLSIYGDLYWQYGWGGVLIGGVLIGWFLAILIARSLIALRKRDFLMMPFVLMSLQVGLLGPNKFVVVGFVGDIPILLFYYLLISSISVILRNKSKASKHASLYPRQGPPIPSYSQRVNTIR